MNKIHRAVILAAGRGQRMAPLTDVMPKPMAPLQGSTLISQGIKALQNHLKEIYITVGYKKAMLAQHVIEVGAAGVINTEGKGNAWWLYHSLLAEIDAPIFVLTCDNVIELDFGLLEENYIRLGEPACMLVPVLPVTGLEGDYIFRNGDKVTAIDRNKVSDIYCSGVQVIHPKKIQNLTQPTEDFYSVWNQLIPKQQLVVSSVYPKRWISIDTYEQLANYKAAEKAP